MEPNALPHNSHPINPAAGRLCSSCHQPVLPEYYFCPNCGHALHEPPLSTSVWTQIGIYAFSIILPVICFIFVTKWPGVKYYKSDDPKAKSIGTIAWVLIVVSTLVTIWLATIWTQEYIQSTVNGINSDLNSYSS